MTGVGVTGVVVADVMMVVMMVGLIEKGGS